MKMLYRSLAVLVMVSACGGTDDPYELSHPLNRDEQDVGLRVSSVWQQSGYKNVPGIPGYERGGLSCTSLMMQGRVVYAYEEELAEWCQSAEVAGCQLTYNSRPLLVIGRDYASRFLLAHEFLHYLMACGYQDPDRSHADPGVWDTPESSDDSMEETLRRRLSGETTRFCPGYLKKVPIDLQDPENGETVACFDRDGTPVWY